MDKDVASIIKEIISCPNIDKYYNNIKNDCDEIIGFQKESDRNNFHIPEPFSGEIDKAKILVISSNPSIDTEKREKYPTYQWDENEILNFFYNRFQTYINNGIKVLRKDGTYSEAIRFEASIKARINEILQIIDKKAVPGIDYCLTEVVHCKSQEEQGVPNAAKCCSRYLKKIIKLSPAPLLVVVGACARNLFCEQYELKKSIDQKVYGPKIIENKERMIYFILHPNARGVKKLDDYLDQSEMKKLTDWVKESFK